MLMQNKRSGLELNTLHYYIFVPIFLSHQTMSFKRAKTVNTLLTISLKGLLSAFLLNEFINEGTGDFEEMEIKLGEGWGQERPLCNLK